MVKLSTVNSRVLIEFNLNKLVYNSVENILFKRYSFVFYSAKSFNS